MTTTEQHEQQQLEEEVFEKDILNTSAEQEDEFDILDIIEELPDEEARDQFDFDKDENTASTTSSSSSSSSNDAREEAHSRPSNFEISLSSIGFALAGTLTASTNSLGHATGKLRQSLTNKSSPREHSGGGGGGQISDSSSRGVKLSESSSRGLSLRFGNKRPVPRVDFGQFEARAARLQYTQEDIFNIADDPAQMDDLRRALRSLGAVTNSVLKQKLHWYVKNSKRARLEAEEQRRQEQERQQEEHKEAESEVEPTTPPTEYKVLDGDKVLRAGGMIDPEDPSPKSVRGIFVPSS